MSHKRCRQRLDKTPSLPAQKHWGGPWYKTGHEIYENFFSKPYKNQL